MTSNLSGHEPYTTYIMVANVKFIKAGEARAVPIRYNDTGKEILKTVFYLNGFIFPGGAMSLIQKNDNLTEYSRKGKLIYDFAKKQNDEGKYFKILGTYLRFQELNVIEAL